MVRVVSHAWNRRFQSFWIETTGAALPREGYRRAVTRRDDARQVLDALQHLLVEVVALLWLFVLLARQYRTHRENLFRLEHRILPEELKQRLNEMTRADKQHEREGNLKHDHRAAQAPGRSHAPA